MDLTSSPVCWIRRDCIWRRLKRKKPAEERLVIPKDKTTLKAQLIRNIFEGVSMGLSFSAIQIIPISTYEVLLNFKGVISSLISHFYLGEKLSKFQFLLVFLSFLGVVMVVDPDLITNLFIQNPVDLADQSQSKSKCICSNPNEWPKSK